MVVVDRSEAGAEGSAMIDECPMTEDCPGYDRDRRVCLLRPVDCEFAPAASEAAAPFETPELPDLRRTDSPAHREI